MKILHYNWTQFDDSNDSGGGVGVYLRTLIKKFTDNGHFVDFVSCGKHFNWSSNTPPRISQTRNSLQNQQVSTYKVSNSPVLAPAHFNFGQLGECFDSASLDNIFRQFCEQRGGYDVIHLHNIEGLTFSTIRELKNHTKLLFLTAHNYHLICPQIELFKHTSSRCDDFHDGADCFGCLPSIPNKQHTIKYRRYKELIGSYPLNFLNTEGSKSQAKALLASAKNLYSEFKVPFWALKMKLKQKQPNERSACDSSWIEQRDRRSRALSELSGVSEVFRSWRAAGIDCSKTTFDKIFAVSDLARDKLVQMGVDPTKVLSTPIGMDIHVSHDVRCERYREKQCDRDALTIAFLGYPIASKGLPTLLSRLEGMSTLNLRRIRLVICSHLDDLSYRRLVGLRSRMQNIEIVAGYARKDLPSILKSIDLGITPSIWWETYNQVSYEFIMHGVPVLMSKHLGISQFLKNQNFIFDPESSTDFEAKIERFLNNRKALDSFWDEEVKLPSFDEHFDDLMKHYSVQN